MRVRPLLARQGPGVGGAQAGGRREPRPLGRETPVARRAATSSTNAEHTEFQGSRGIKNKPQNPAMTMWVQMEII